MKEKLEQAIAECLKNNGYFVRQVSLEGDGSNNLLMSTFKLRIMAANKDSEKNLYNQAKQLTA